MKVKIVKKNIKRPKGKKKDYIYQITVDGICFDADTLK